MGNLFKVRMGVPDMEALWNDLATRYEQGQFSKDEQKFFKKLVKALGYMEVNPRQPASSRRTSASQRVPREILSLPGGADSYRGRPRLAELGGANCRKTSAATWTSSAGSTSSWSP